MRHTLCISFLMLSCLGALPQRNYTETSVLATGDWYRIQAGPSGVYRITAAMLRTMGISLPQPSPSIRIFGNGGRMLPEDNRPRPDDLRESAIQVEDGGDGQFDGNDFLLFYAVGAEEWVPDPAVRTFSYRKHLYTDSVVYFLRIGGQGLRTVSQTPPPTATVEVSQYDFRLHHELDLINFLSSGKEWYGEEFSQIPGGQSRRTYTYTIPGLVRTWPLTVASEVVGRSVGQASRFDCRLNQQQVYEHVLPPLPGVLYEPVASSSTRSAPVLATGSTVQLEFAFQQGSVNSQGWLNWFTVLGRRSLEMAGQPALDFRDWQSVGAGQTATFLVGASDPATRVWDLSDPSRPVDMQLTRSGTQLSFTNDASVLRDYIAFQPALQPQPRILGRMPNQNLHRPEEAGMIIVTVPSLLGEAQRLADHHRDLDGLRSVVVTVGEIYNEFSSGNPDPTALRDFVKMFFDRAGTDTARRPRYLLLFGDASFDYRDRLQANTNLVPAWQSRNSLEPLVTHTSDDFFGLLDDADDINLLAPAALLDLGIGRIPAANAAEARIAVDKILRYRSAASTGPWRNQLLFIADDEDRNVHLNDAEFHVNTVSPDSAVWNPGKIYLDAYRQESGSGGSRYPEVNEAINRQIFNGILLFNYSGHGGSSRLAQEAILDERMVDGWQNDTRLPLFITATCDFAPFDNPLVKSIGEKIIFKERGGGIALMTTTRLVFAFSNRVINNNYLRIALQPDRDGRYLTLGAAVRDAKNFTVQNFGDVVNARKFTLLGDPALRLAFPEGRVTAESLNGRPIAGGTDTLKALNRYLLEGEVRDRRGQPLRDFNGDVFLSIYDKVRKQSTIVNDPTSQPADFETRSNLIYKGKVKAVNGRYAATFIVPKDINYQFGPGRISIYAADTERDGSGTNDALIVGGLGNEVADDGEGPVIRAYLNDERFVDGSVTNTTPVLILKLADSSGINTVGTGIGHDLTAVLDGDTRQSYVLNDFYETETGSFQRGTVRFPLPTLEEGPHQLRIRAWDMFNNVTEKEIGFRVVKETDLVIEHVLNYPNPFSTRTEFWFEHNRPGENLVVTVQIMTITGKTVKTMTQTINNTGNRSNDIVWDGRDAAGARLARGVYIYRLRVQGADGKSREKIDKLVIL